MTGGAVEQGGRRGSGGKGVLGRMVRRPDRLEQGSPAVFGRSIF